MTRVASGIRAAATVAGMAGAFEAILGRDQHPVEGDDNISEDARWMRRALVVATASQARAEPNPRVGCVIVRDGEMLAFAATERYGLRHAERCAIDSVEDRAALRGATLYSTLEPCSHWGRQPPCADLVASVGFARCVIGISDPNPRVSGRGIARIRSAGAEVASGILAGEAFAWHLPHVVRALRGRPLISALATRAVDLDAEAGRADHSSEVRMYLRALWQRADVLVAEPTPRSIQRIGRRGNARAVLWWDLEGELRRSSPHQARRVVGAIAAIGVPGVIAVRGCDDRLRHLGAHHGIAVLESAEAVDPLTWLLVSARSDEMCRSIGAPPNWLLIDHHTSAAAALVAQDGLDALHVVTTSSRFATQARAGMGEIPQTQTFVPAVQRQFSTATLAEYYSATTAVLFEVVSRTVR